MKLIVLGATGGIGLEIVRQAIDRGHSVTAFVRSASSFRKFSVSIFLEAAGMSLASCPKRIDPWRRTQIVSILHLP
jgi:putative NADH-flavin reductase